MPKNSIVFYLQSTAVFPNWHAFENVEHSVFVSTLCSLSFQGLFREQCGCCSDCCSPKYYPSLELAAIAYNEAAILYHGEFAKIEFCPCRRMAMWSPLSSPK
jgi:hypothetical protein